MMMSGICLMMVGRWFDIVWSLDRVRGSGEGDCGGQRCDVRLTAARGELHRDGHGGL